MVGFNKIYEFVSLFRNRCHKIVHTCDGATPDDILIRQCRATRHKIACKQNVNAFKIKEQINTSMVFPWQISFFCQLGFRNILIALSRKFAILVQKNLQQYHLLLSFIFTSFTSYAVSLGAISWMDRYSSVFEKENRILAKMYDLILEWKV